MTELEEACERYLAQQPFTLWGDYEIKRPERRKEAAKWLARQVEGVLDTKEKMRCEGKSRLGWVLRRRGSSPWRW